MKKTPAILAVTVAILLMAASLAACDRLSPAAPDVLNPTPEWEDPLLASVIWQEYQGEDTYANDQYKNRWAKIVVDGVRQTEKGVGAGIDAVSGAKLILRTSGQIASMEFEFRFIEEAQDYERGARPTVLCNIKGTDLLRTKIDFIHCRPTLEKDT